MRQLRPASEDEMIATFLQQELASARFGPIVRRILAREQLPVHVVAQPNLESVRDNECRTRILARHRGYREPGDEYLATFPAADTQWAWCVLTVPEVRRVKYIDWDYWLEITHGSRLPADAARRIVAGERAADVSNEAFLAAAELLRAGGSLPPPILVGTDPDAPLVILEGHVRMTAYALAPEAVPPDFHALIGLSPLMRHWECY